MSSHELDQRIRQLLAQHLAAQEAKEERFSNLRRIRIGDVFAYRAQKITVLLEVIGDADKDQVLVRTVGTNGNVQKLSRERIGAFSCSIANMNPFLREMSDQDWNVEEIRARERERRQARQHVPLEDPGQLEQHEVNILYRLISNVVKRNILQKNFAPEFSFQINLRKYSYSEKILEHVRQRVNQDIAVVGFEITTLAQVSPYSLAFYLGEIPLWQ